MAPDIALIGCILFIFAMIIYDQKDKPNVSYAQFIPLAWILFCASAGIGRYFLEPSSIPMDIREGNPVDRPVLSIIIILGCIILIKRRIEWAAFYKRNNWVIILFAFMGLSIMWSDFPSVSLKRWIRSIGDLIMVMVVLSEENPLECIKRLIRRCAVITLPISILFIKYFRHLGVAYTVDGEFTMEVGITSHKNELGALAMICALFFIWSILYNWQNRKNRYVHIIFLAISLWLLAGSTTSQSKTAILNFLFGGLILGLLRMKKPNPRNCWRILLLFALPTIIGNLTVGVFDEISLFEFFVRSSGRDPTLTGRTDLWNDLLIIASGNPLVGRGYGSFWIGNLTHNLWEKHIWLPTQAHNGYLDTYLELGLVGVLFLFLIIIFGYKKIFENLNINFQYASLRLTFFLVVVMHNISESTFLRGTSLLWFVFLLFGVDPLKKREALKESMG